MYSRWVIIAGTAGSMLMGRGEASGQEGAAAAVPPVGTGVSSALAHWRAARVHDISYDLHFTIPANRDQQVLTTETMAFELSENSRALQLDFKKGSSEPGRLEVNGVGAPADYREEHIIVPSRLLRVGKNKISLRYSSTSQPLNRNGDFLYTLLVPDRARSLFACLDQPDCKAVFRLTLTLPLGWKAVANGPLLDTARDGDAMVWHFKSSDTISTYLFAFAAGRFTEAVDSGAMDNGKGRGMRFLYRETDSVKIRLSMGPIFQIQKDALSFMHRYTGIAYPFQKFDFVAIPDFQFGGMEHPGAIQYKASSLFLDSGATRDQFLGRSNLLAHETAHMWFGDLVTMRWFDDVWMKEVFANFMADKIGNITMPDGQYDLKFLTAHYPAAYSTDRTMGSHPIRQVLPNLQDAGSLYGNIIYHKAPIMMRQLEALMGADAFRDGLRDYLQRYAGGNAGWPDLIRILGQHTDADLKAWDSVWVNSPGRPRFTYRLTADKGIIRSLDIVQRAESGRERVWPQRFDIALVYEDHMERLTVHSDRASMALSGAVGKKEPLYVLFNANGLGYGVFPVDGKSLLHITEIEDPVTRASFYINLYENLLNGQVVGPNEFLAMFGKALGREHEELNLNLLADQLGSIYWRYLGPGARDSLASQLEPEIWKAMEEGRSANERKILFKAYSNIVLTREGEDRLYEIWRTQRPPAGVTLTEDDYTGMAAALAIRAYPATKEILDEQGMRIQNRDRKERWQYLLPALSGDTTERDAFFASLGRQEGRRKESWVLTGLSYLHHPLRTGVSEKYLPRTLELLEEVQQTGDVFFPQGWLGTSLAWYKTASAAAIVWRFLDAHPGYNPKLRDKLLQSADYLFRISR